MGLLKDAAVELGISVGISALEAGGKAADYVSEKLSDSRENKNLHSLKKQVKKSDHCLFVTLEKNLGDGIYRISEQKDKPRYNTLKEHRENGDYILHIYNERKGEIAAVQKIVKMKKTLFSSKPDSVRYYIYSNGQLFCEIQKQEEGSRSVYVNTANDWMITGDFEKEKYKFFSKSSGKTIAEVSKKVASASTYIVFCEYSKHEPIILAMTLLLDIEEAGKRNGNQ